MREFYIPGQVQRKSSDLKRTIYYVGPLSEGFQYPTINAALTRAILDNRGPSSPATILVSPGIYNENIALTVPQIHIQGLTTNESFATTIEGTLDIDLVGGATETRFVVLENLRFAEEGTVGSGVTSVEQFIILETVQIQSDTGIGLLVDLPNGGLIEATNLRLLGGPALQIEAGAILWFHGSCRSDIGGTSVLINGGQANCEAVEMSGKILIENDGSFIGALAGFEASAEVLETNSTSFSLLAICLMNTTTEPGVIGTGVFGFFNVATLPGYNTGDAFSATLNSGLGAISFPVVPS
mgnify:CR=1 FL=1